MYAWMLEGRYLTPDPVIWTRGIFPDAKLGELISKTQVKPEGQNRRPDRENNAVLSGNDQTQIRAYFPSYGAGNNEQKLFHKLHLTPNPHANQENMLETDIAGPSTRGSPLKIRHLENSCAFFDFRPYNTLKSYRV